MKPPSSSIRMSYLEEIPDHVLSQMSIPDAEVTQGSFPVSQRQECYQHSFISDSVVSGTQPPSTSSVISESFVKETAPSYTNSVISDAPNGISSSISSTKQQYSSEATSYMGRKIVTNTEQSNKTAIRRFTTFVLSKMDLSNVTVATEKAEWNLFATRMGIENQDDDKNAENMNDSINLIRKILFPDSMASYLPSGYSNWNTEQLENIKYYLVEFAVRYRKDNGSEVSPQTMKGYICGLQRYFENEWGYKLRLLDGEIFGNKENGLRCVLENRFNDQQSRGMVTKSHNVLSYEDLVKLYDSDELSKRTPSSFQCRLIFHIALSTAMRASEMLHLRLSQLSFINQKGQDVLMIVGTIGSKKGASKNAPGGISAIKQRPKEICIWNKWQMDGKINIYEDIKQYYDLRNKMVLKGENHDRFFTAINPRATSFESFFKCQPLGEHTLRRYIKEACEKNGITGIGPNDAVVTHSLRGTVTSLLIESGTPDTAVSLHTGHRKLENLKPYQNMRGKEGMLHQSILFDNLKRDQPTGDAISSENIKNSKTSEKPHTSELQSSDVPFLQQETVQRDSSAREVTVENGCNFPEVRSLLGSVNCSGGVVNFNIYTSNKP